MGAAGLGQRERAGVRKRGVGLLRARVGKGYLSDAVITLSTASVKMDNLRKTQKKKTVVRLKLHARVK